MKKLIAVDLDGTLLKSDGKASKNTMAYLDKLKKDGHIITIATGRMLSSALDATEGAYFSNYVICDEGSLIYNTNTKEFIHKDIIQKDLINDVCMFYDKYSYLTLCTPNNIYKVYNKENTFINDINKIVSKYEDFMHITIGLKNPNNIKEVKNTLCNKIPDLKFLIMQDSFSDNKWFDIFVKGNSKYNSMLKVANIENISKDDIICFGDGLNDIDMIKKSEVGVAMGNALDEVKEVADFITDTNDQDGIITFLENVIQ